MNRAQKSHETSGDIVFEAYLKRLRYELSSSNVICCQCNSLRLLECWNFWRNKIIDSWVVTPWLWISFLFLVCELESRRYPVPILIRVTVYTVGTDGGHANLQNTPFFLFHLPVFVCLLFITRDLPCLRVEFLLKIDSGYPKYPKDTGVTLFTLATRGNPLRYNTNRSAPPVSALAHSMTPGDLGRGPSHQSTCSNIETRIYFSNSLLFNPSKPQHLFDS